MANPLEFTDVFGNRPNNRESALQCTGFLAAVGSLGFANSYALVAGGQAKTQVISASGFVSFNLMADCTGVAVLFSLVPISPIDQSELPQIDMTALPAATQQKLSFGFRGDYADDLVFLYFKLLFTNTDGANPGSVDNLMLWSSSL